MTKSQLCFLQQHHNTQSESSFLKGAGAWLLLPEVGEKNITHMQEGTDGWAGTFEFLQATHTHTQIAAALAATGKKPPPYKGQSC